MSDDAFSRYWNDLARSLSLDDTVSRSCLEDLRGNYGAPSRHYHTLTHIVAMLQGADGLSFADRDMVCLAIIFHDVIYDAARFDNEARSADVLREKLAGLVPDKPLDKAAQMILATQKHQGTGDADTDLLLDLDMAILGQPWPVYERYARGVMAEYIPVYGEDAYRQGRVNLFLDPTLARGSIYLTDAFRHLDAPAMDNLRREKAWLQET